MIVLNTVNEMRRASAALKTNGQRLGFIPTMGALHAGHLSLIEAAQKRGERTAVSVFVNPTQFGPNEDFDAYPRMPEKDLAALEKAGVDAVFLPEREIIYPGVSRLYIEIKELGQLLCGKSRPTFFQGVALVVTKLLNIVQPDALYLGKKDFQQTVILSTLVREMFLPVETVVCPILREDDGLAMSSRNLYLSPAERALAPEVYRTLNVARQTAQTTNNVAHIRQAALDYLAKFPELKLDYLEICRKADLSIPETLSTDDPAIALIALWLGKTRLIDNIDLA